MHHCDTRARSTLALSPSCDNSRIRYIIPVQSRRHLLLTTLNTFYVVYPFTFLNEAVIMYAVIMY